jgi:hypothetical protein
VPVNADALNAVFRISLKDGIPRRTSNYKLINIDLVHNFMKSDNRIKIDFSTVLFGFSSLIKDDQICYG